jgi:hypothetical protein
MRSAPRDARLDATLDDERACFSDATPTSHAPLEQLNWFRNRLDAKVGIEQWRRHYNDVRPHSSLGYLTPLEFKATCAADRDSGRSPAMPARADQEEHGNNVSLTGAILQ